MKRDKTTRQTGRDGEEPSEQAEMKQQAELNPLLEVRFGQLVSASKNVPHVGTCPVSSALREEQQRNHPSHCLAAAWGGGELTNE